MPEITLEIANVLNQLITQMGISEAALGRKIGVPRATINRLVSGKTPDPRASTLKAIADFFEITIDQLLGEKLLLNQSQENELNTNMNKRIPIIDWDKANQWSCINRGLASDVHSKWLLTDPNIDGGRFAIIFNGESMWPRFDADTILIVEPEKTPKNRDFVIAYIYETEEILFRQLIMDGKCSFLKPINDMFPTIQMSDIDKLIGIVVESRNKHE